MDFRANRAAAFGPGVSAVVGNAAPGPGRVAAPVRLPLRSFRGGAAIRPDSVDPAPPRLSVPPRGPVPASSRSDAGVVLDRELVALAAADARCRLVRARIAERVIATRCWRALGYVRLGDFARERLGLSPRSLEDDARVLHALAALPALRSALEGGDLSWTRTRILVRSATPDNENQLLDASRSVPMREMDDWVREWPGAERGLSDAATATSGREAEPGFSDTATGTGGRGATRGLSDVATANVASSASPRGNPTRPPPGNSMFPATIGIHDEASTDDPLVRCSLELSRTGRRLWRAAGEYASRSAGSPLSPGQVLELVVAEAASSLPQATADERASQQADSKRSAAPSEFSAPSPEFHERRLRAAIRAREARGRRGLLTFLAEYGAAEGFGWLDPASRDPGPARAVDALLEELELTDAFELERRLQRMRLLSQRLEAQMAALLRVGIDQGLFHELGFATVPLYAEARLGICRRRMWSLVAIERHSWKTSRLLHAAWRDGHLTLLQATTLLPVIDEKNTEAWILRAREVTLRRLQDEVAWAQGHRDATASCVSLLPPAVDADVRRDSQTDLRDDEVQKRAHGPVPQGSLDVPGEVHIHVFVPLSVAVLMETTLDRLQRTGEARWNALERMIALALLEWRSTPRHRDPIFERDGWRCAVPGCSSRRNLQDHHVVFRSQGGGNARDNRITVCAAHHLHGIHAGIVRAWGTAPQEIVWELGCSPGREPLVRLLGDRLLHDEAGDRC